VYYLNIDDILRSMIYYTIKNTPGQSVGFSQPGRILCGGSVNCRKQV
jgi:hypothetical protein